MGGDAPAATPVRTREQRAAFRSGTTATSIAGPGRRVSLHRSPGDETHATQTHTHRTNECAHITRAQERRGRAHSDETVRARARAHLSRRIMTRAHAGEERESARREEDAQDNDARDMVAGDRGRPTTGRSEQSQELPRSAGRSATGAEATRDEPGPGATSDAARDDAVGDQTSDEDFDPDGFEEEPYEPPQPAGTGRPGGSQALGLTLGNNLFGYVLGFHPIEIERYKDV